MVFQLRPEDTRKHQYPNAQDPDFLGYDRPSDRWKVDASGIKLYASGVQVDLDKGTDSVAAWSASGTPAVETWINSPVETVSVDPVSRTLVKKRVLYDVDKNPIEMREANIITPSGGQCVTRKFSYDSDGDIEYVTESHGTW